MMISVRELYELAKKGDYDLNPEETMECLRDGVMKRISFFMDESAESIEQLNEYLHPGETLVESSEQMNQGFTAYELRRVI